MKKIMFVCVFVMLLLTTSFGYTLTIKNGDYTLVREGIMPNTTVSFGLNGPIDWSADIASLQINRLNLQSAEMLMPESNVIITLRRSTVQGIVAAGDYIKLNNGPATIAISTNGGESQPLSVNNTIWRVQSDTSNVLEVTPTSSLGNLKLYGKSDYDDFNNIHSRIINSLIGTGFFSSGRKLGYEEILTYMPNFAFWAGYYFSYSQDSVHYKYGVVWNGSRYAEGTHTLWSTNYYENVIYEEFYRTSGVCEVMSLCDLILVGGTGTSTDPWLVSL